MTIEIKEINDMYTAQGTLSMDAQLKQYAPMVKRLAHHLLGKLPANVQFDDMFQAGMIGLMDAIGRYEEGLGTQFETYANQRIRGSMLDELRNNDWLPRSVRKNQRAIQSAMSRLEQRLGRAATESEIASEMKVSLDRYQELLQDAKGSQLFYIDDYGSDDDNGNYLDRHVADTGNDPVEKLNDKRFRAELVKHIGGLPEREKQLMGLYYEQELNFREIAAVMGVTESRICQLHTQAVTRLRAKLKDW
jgi:RNA polymerase sigma factor for flagellar operon FliA